MLQAERNKVIQRNAIPEHLKPHKGMIESIRRKEVKFKAMRRETRRRRRAATCLEELKLLGKQKLQVKGLNLRNTLLLLRAVNSEPAEH